MACRVGPASPATIATGRLVHEAAVSAASSSTGPVQADVADRELRGVHADGQSSGAGIEVIARQRPLMPDIERAVGIERERMRREHRAVGDQLANVGLDFAMVHDGTSYPNSGPATANGSCAGGAVGRPKRMR